MAKFRERSISPNLYAASKLSTRFQLVLSGTGFKLEDFCKLMVESGFNKTEIVQDLFYMTLGSFNNFEIELNFEVVEGKDD